MKLLNLVKLSVFVKEGEDKEVLAKKLKSFLPFDLEKEKIKINSKNCMGFEEKKIIVLSIIIEKERHTNAFLKQLSEKLAEKQLLINQAESRLDEDFNFFIRFDKTKLVEKDEYWITESGNCFHIKMNIACFPRKREKALEIVQKIFK